MTEAEIGSGAAGPLVRLRLVPGRLLWRIGPAWSVLAGALAAGAPVLGADALFRLAAAAILADLLWGALREIGQAPPEQVSEHGSPVFLPYARPDAPLGAFLGRLAFAQGGDARASWQGLLLGLALMGAMSVLLGPAAIALSAAVLLLWAWMQRSGVVPCLDAVLDVALPWLLGTFLAGRGALSWQVLALAAAFTLLQWGVLRARQGTVVAWIGQGAVLVVLIAIQQPGALAGVAMLLAPAAWWLAAQRGGVPTHALPWWWGAMLIAALAAR